MINRSSVLLVLAAVIGVVFANVRIEVENGETRGTWKPNVFNYFRCAPGARATGYQIQIDRALINRDKQGMTGILIYCDDGSVANATVDGAEGRFLRQMDCSGVGNPYLVDFQLRVLPHNPMNETAPDDQMGATDIKFRCSNGNELNNLNGLNGGDWSLNWSNSCINFGGICGVQIRYKALSIPLADNSGINDVRFECCQ